MVTGKDEIVGINGNGIPRDAFKDVRARNPFQLEPGLAFFVDRLDFDLFSARQQGADDEARLVAKRMHTEQRVRGLMGQVYQTAKFVG